MCKTNNAIKFSIITVTLNSGNLLELTIESVLSQNYTNYEYIIKDGGSTDGYVDSIKNNANIKLIQGLDTGIYDAMNQAAVAATGNILCFLNAGDTFTNDNVLSDVALYIQNKIEGVFYGDYISKYGDVCVLPRKMTMGFFHRSFLCHQSVFYRTNSFIKYNISFRLLADHDLHLKLYSNGIPFEYIPVIVCKYLGNGASESPLNAKVHKEEKKRIRRQYFSKRRLIIYSIRDIICLSYMRRIFLHANTPKIIYKCYRKLVTFFRKISN